MSTELDATSFVISKGFYYKEFDAILNLLIHCYNDLMTNEHPKSYPKGFKLENHLRNVLVKKYLRINKEKFGISYLGFEIESGEIDLNNVTVGFIDIKVTNAGLNTSMKCDEDIYYAIECKRLDKYSQKITGYVGEGIFRFVDGKYSSKMPIACMIGFVEKNNPTEIVEKINKKLKNYGKIETLQNLRKYDFRSDFDFSYLSKHKRKTTADTIDIYHLMFDYTSLILIK